MPPVETSRHIVRARLLEETGASLRRWARDHDYAEGVIGKVLSRFLGKPYRPTPGTMSLAIIEGLEADTGLTLCGSAEKEGVA